MCERYEDRDSYEANQGVADADWEEYEENCGVNDELSDEDEYPPENM